MIVEGHYEIIKVKIELPLEEAQRLYVDINKVLEVAGVDFAGHRNRLDIPMIYKLYDELYKVDNVC